MSFIALAGFAIAAAPISDAQEKRLALVIGNSAYAELNQLSNPVNDARLMRTTLQSLGFEVVYRENVDKRSMEKVILEYADKLAASGRDTVALVYYAGHGVQAAGENYLLPVDVPIHSQRDLSFSGIETDKVLRAMDSAQPRVKIIILDACRDNPFEQAGRTLTRSGGLADISVGNMEFYIAYAATAGNVAWDGDGNAKNSPYAQALAKRLVMPDAEINETFRLVRNDVAEMTHGRQLPEGRSTLRDQFYFNPKSKNLKIATADPPAMPPVAAPPVAPSLSPAATAAPLSRSQPFGDASGDQQPIPVGVKVTPNDLVGKWCDAARGGTDFSMMIKANRIEQLFGGHSFVYVVNTISQPRDDVLQMVSKQNNVMDVSEYGEFSADKSSMSYLRRKQGAGEWQVLQNRRYKRC